MSKNIPENHIIPADNSLIESGDLLEFFVEKVRYTYRLIHTVGKMTVGEFKNYNYDEKGLQVLREKKLSK